MPVELPTSAGRAQQTAVGQQHSDLPKDVWTGAGGTLEFGMEHFSVAWIPQRGSSANIDSLVEGVSWDDASAVLTGEITFRDPGYGQRVPDIDDGDEFILTCTRTGAHGGAGILWRMRCVQPNRNFKGGVRTLQLTNALGWLARSIDDFKYVRDKKRKPKGWTCDEIVLDIARRYQIPVGTIVQGTHRIKNLVMLNASPLDVIAAAYRRERTYTGKRYVLSCRFGKLDVTPLQRSRRLLELGPTLIDATLQQSMKEGFATALTVRATGKVEKGKDKAGNRLTDTRKIVVKVSSPSAIKRLGYVHQNFNANDADTEGEAEAAGLRHIVNVAKPVNELTLNHPGIPDIQRGDALKALLPDDALNQVIFVTEARHQVTPGNYTMDIQVAFTDPFVDAKAERAQQKKEDAARRRGRTHRTEAKTPPKPPGAGQRDTTPGERLTGRGHP